MILFVILTAHFLADFTFQSSELAAKKEVEFKYLLKHSLIYLIVVACAFLLCLPLKTACLPCIIVVVSHFLIDHIRCLVDRRWANSISKFATFIIDQLLHTGIIVAVCFFFCTKESSIFSKLLEYKWGTKAIVHLLIAVLLLDVSAVFIKKLFAKLNFDKNNTANGTVITTSATCGRIIGKLERLIIMVLVLNNQLSGIGFVITAKSLARFKQFEDPDFAEKYLVGTLTSTFIAVVVTLALQNFI